MQILVFGDRGIAILRKCGLEHVPDAGFPIDEGSVDVEGEETVVEEIRHFVVFLSIID
jgi:hypothetical protein